MFLTCNPLDETDPFGAKILEDGTTRFRWWSPQQKKLHDKGLIPRTPSIVFPDSNESLPMNYIGSGWYEFMASNKGHGTRYAYRFWNLHGRHPGWLTVPDPMSYWQEKDVLGYSRVLDPQELIQDRIAWQGVRHEDLVATQIHIGTFTSEGTFNAAREKLPHIASIGFTAIQLMPIEAGAARAGWGYDGVLKGAIQPEYGTPEDFAAFVNDAHSHGLAVLTDQVFNHFAAPGNFLDNHTPEFFKFQNMDTIEKQPLKKRKPVKGYKTPWGTALDLSRPEVRKFIEQLEWHNQAHYGTDGVRRDAVHGLMDDQAKEGYPHILTSMTQKRKSLAAESGRVFHVINEDEYDRPTLYAYDDGRRDENRIRADMQWGDNFHHALFVAVTRDNIDINSDLANLLTNRKSYYHPYMQDNQAALIAETIVTGNAFSLDTERNARTTEEDLEVIPDPRTKIVFSTNHDHIGNTPSGVRLAEYLKDDPYREQKIDFVNTLTALHPAAVPQFFMGQEWQSESPFPYFAVFDDEKINESYRKGRKKELAQFNDFIDPASMETVNKAKLDWHKAVNGNPAMDRFRELFALRRLLISPHLASGIEKMDVETLSGNAACITTLYKDGASFALLFNAGDTAVSYPGGILQPWGTGYNAKSLLVIKPSLLEMPAQ